MLSDICMGQKHGWNNIRILLDSYSYRREFTADNNFKVYSPGTGDTNGVIIADLRNFM